MGMTVGNLVAPPVAGILYQRWGFRAPFIFGIIITGVDLLARLLLIERHDATRWGIDPVVIDKENTFEIALPRTTAPWREEQSPPFESNEKPKGGNLQEGQLQEPEQSRVTLLPHIVLLKLIKSPRAMVSIVLSLIWGLGWVSQETTVVLHMNRVWGLDPRQAGTAFIAAIVPTVLCESSIFPLPRLVTYANCVSYSRGSFRLVSR